MTELTVSISLSACRVQKLPFQMGKRAGFDQKGWGNFLAVFNYQLCGKLKAIQSQTRVILYFPLFDTRKSIDRTKKIISEMLLESQTLLERFCVFKLGLLDLYLSEHLTGKTTWKSGAV